LLASTRRDGIVIVRKIAISPLLCGGSLFWRFRSSAA
jgi:hypothetical protein